MVPVVSPETQTPVYTIVHSSPMRASGGRYGIGGKYIVHRHLGNGRKMLAGVFTSEKQAKAFIASQQR